MAKVFSNLSGKFHKYEETEEYKLIQFVGNMFPSNLTEEELAWVKWFYSMKPETRHAVLDSDRPYNNGYLKLYKENNDHVC